MAFIYISPSTVDLKGYGQDYKVLGQLIASILTMTPQRSGLEPAPLLNILTGLLLAKLSIPSSLAKYLRTVLPWPITAEIHKENQVRDNHDKHNCLFRHFLPLWLYFTKFKGHFYKLLKPCNAKM